eukprot:NODE_513_length_7367_cov_0.288663.p1 type:complete len:590 gc:universal NODE_513_length_7367_cov_0.288663:4095-2326(-)
MVKYSIYFNFKAQTMERLVDNIRELWKSNCNRQLFEESKELTNILNEICSKIEKLNSSETCSSGGNMAIIAPKGMGKSFLLKNLKKLLDIHFKNDKKMLILYTDFSVAQNCRPRNLILKELYNPEYGDIADSLQNVSDVDFYSELYTRYGFKVAYFSDEIHHVYDWTSKEHSIQCINDIYHMAKGSGYYSIITSSSLKLKKRAFADFGNYPNLNKTCHIEWSLNPIRTKEFITKYMQRYDLVPEHITDINIQEVFKYTGSIPRLLDSYNFDSHHTPISQQDLYEYMDDDPILNKICFLFLELLHGTNYKSCNYFTLPKLNTESIFEYINDCPKGDILRCLSDFRDNDLFYSQNHIVYEFLYPHLYSYLSGYFQTKPTLKSKLVWDLILRPTDPSLGHYGEREILEKSELLGLGVYKNVIKEDSTIEDGVYRNGGSADNGLDGYRFVGNTVDIIQVKLTKLVDNATWADGFRKNVYHRFNIAVDKDGTSAKFSVSKRSLTMTKAPGNLELASSQNMKNIILRCARNWATFKKTHPEYRLGKLIFISTQKISEESETLLKNTKKIKHLKEEHKLQGYKIIGLEELDPIIPK